MNLNRASKKNHNMKEKILLTSIDLMTKNGINNTSLADIAREVNISKGTLYYHYSSKDDIIFDIADNHLNIISEALLDCLKKINFILVQKSLYLWYLKIFLILKVLVEYICT